MFHSILCLQYQNGSWALIALSILGIPSPGFIGAELGIFIIVSCAVFFALYKSYTVNEQLTLYTFAIFMLYFAITAGNQLNQVLAPLFSVDPGSTNLLPEIITMGVSIFLLVSSIGVYAYHHTKDRSVIGWSILFSFVYTTMLLIAGQALLFSNIFNSFPPFTLLWVAYSIVAIFLYLWWLARREKTSLHDTIRFGIRTLLVISAVYVPIILFM